MIYALRHYTLPLLLALALHASAVLALYNGFQPEKSVQNFVKPQMVVANLIMLEPKAKPAPVVRKAPPPAKPKPDPNLAKRERERKATEAEERKARAAEEAKRKADQELAEAERAAAERQRRLQELAALAQTSLDESIAAESAELQAGSEEAVAMSYRAGIYNLVRQNWSRPPSARNGMSARLQVELIPTGEVVSVTIVDTSGNPAFDRSAEQAVRRAGRFEVPAENHIFETYFRRFYFLFQPEDLLR